MVAFSFHLIRAYTSIAFLTHLDSVGIGNAKSIVYIRSINWICCFKEVWHGFMYTQCV